MEGREVLSPEHQPSWLFPSNAVWFLGPPWEGDSPLLPPSVSSTWTLATQVRSSTRYHHQANVASRTERERQRQRQSCKHSVLSLRERARMLRRGFACLHHSPIILFAGVACSSSGQGVGNI